MKTYEAIDTFVKFDNFNIKDLYNQYKKNYKKIHKYANHIRKVYSKTTDKEKIKYRKIIYDIEKELLEILIKLESYLPYKERYYTHKELNKFLNLVYDKSSSVGFTPIEFKINNNEELIQNKILQNELLRMMKELLTKKQYSCMYMYFYQGMTQEEIANIMKMTQANVNIHLKNSIKIISNSEYFNNVLYYLGCDVKLDNE